MVTFCSQTGVTCNRRYSLNFEVQMVKLTALILNDFSQTIDPLTYTRKNRTRLDLANEVAIMPSIVTKSMLERRECN